MSVTETTRVVSTSKGDVTIFRLVNTSGAWVELSTLGAGVVGIGVPDRNGEIADVAMGYDEIESYTADLPNSGKTCGRFANRIAYGHLEIDGKVYNLDVNCGEHHLHGGVDGFQHRNWHGALVGEGEVEFNLVSEDGDQHYPGRLTVAVYYKWDDDNRLTIGYKAETDAPTAVNLTNHTYFNLGGHNSGTALNHYLTLECRRYMEVDSTMRPTGRLLAVEGTPLDFNSAHRLGEHIKDDFEALKIAKGYDFCWVRDNGSTGIKPVARLYEEKSGRTLDIASDQPGVQVYTANWLIGSTPAGKEGAEYSDYDFVAVECQGLPDAPNHPQFDSAILRPGEVYERTIIYQFTIH